MQTVKGLTDRILSELQTTSEITTSRKATPSVTLAQHGAIGSETTSVLKGPAAHTKKMEGLLPLSVQTSLKSKYRTDPEARDTEAMVLVVPVPESDLSEARDLLLRSLKPATNDECQMALAELKALTRTKKEDVDDIRVVLKAYARKLQDYPRDVTLHVLSTQSNISAWWPAWADLRERLEIYTSKRRRILAALRAGNAA